MAKHRLCLFVILITVLLSGCTVHGEAFFRGRVVNISSDYIIVAPDPTEPIAATSSLILVPLNVVSANGVPELTVSEHVQIVYNKAVHTHDRTELDIVYAIYKTKDLVQTP